MVRLALPRARWRASLFAGSSLVFAIVAAFAGCVGWVEEPEVRARTGPHYTCADSARGLADREMRRLTRDELVATLTSAFGADVMASERVAAEVALFPSESPYDLVHDFQNTHATQHVLALFQIAEAVAETIASDPSASARVFGECAPTADRACADQLLDRLAMALWRRPIADERRATYLAQFDEVGGGPEGLQHVATIMIQAPELAFHLDALELECEGATCAPPPPVAGARRLDAYTVASRIAYAITGGPPDEALLDAAARGELGTIEEARAHALRLSGAPAARRQFERVLSAWLQLAKVPDPHAAIATANGVDPAGLGLEAQRELLDYATFMVFDRDADAAAWMSEPLGFPRSERMAALYGSEQATGDEPVALPDGHGGLLARIAPMLAGNLTSSPILRGAYVRRVLLCGTIPSPPGEVLSAALEEIERVDRTMVSNRQVVEELTSPALCASCHQLVNPLGFALEAFDSLGQRRSEEIVYDETGSVIASHPLDTRVHHPEVEEGGPALLEGPEDLTAALAESHSVRACIAERFFSHTRLRPIARADHCAVAEVEEILRGGGSVRDAWIASVVNDELFVRGEVEP